LGHWLSHELLAGTLTEKHWLREALRDGTLTEKLVLTLAETLKLCQAKIYNILVNIRTCYQ